MGVEADKQDDVVANALGPPLKGPAPECYGVGNAPSRDRLLLLALREATARGELTSTRQR